MSIITVPNNPYPIKRIVPPLNPKVVTSGGVRWYLFESEKTPYPSVTSVLAVDPKTKKGLAEWRKRVGEEESKRIGKLAAENGTVVHELIESFFEGQAQKTISDLIPPPLYRSPKEEKYTEHQKWQAEELKSRITNLDIEKVFGIECQMFSRQLRVAGTCDWVGKIGGDVVVADWKTSNKPKRKAWITNYFVQQAVYSKMFEEMTGLQVGKILTGIVNNNYSSDLFWEEPDNWIDKFLELRYIFEQEHDIPELSRFS